MGVINKTTEKINNLLDKVETLPEEGLVGKTPVFDIGYVTTVSAGSPANVDIRKNGVDEDGNPIYLIDFEIPKCSFRKSRNLFNGYNWFSTYI